MRQASDFALIADLRGVLVELRPLTDEAWELLFEQSGEEEHIGVMGLDVFSKDAIAGPPCIDALLGNRHWFSSEKRYMPSGLSMF